MRLHIEGDRATHRHLRQRCPGLGLAEEALLVDGGTVVADIAQLRNRIMERRQIGERQLSRLVSAKQHQAFLPPRLALLAVAMESGLAITRYASDDDLALLRDANAGAKSSAASKGDGPAPRRTTAAKAPRKQGVAAPAARKRVSKKKDTSASRAVFVVHGRHEELRRSVFDFLRALGLKPMEWRTAIGLTGAPNPSISEILDAAFSEASAVVVLLTPDDDVSLRPVHRKPSDPPYEARRIGQARPNVLFELGLAFGRNERATVVVQVGDVKPFSDLIGRHITRLDNSPEKRSEFVTKLRNAGCDVDDSGTDWFSAGDFALGTGTGGKGGKR